MRIGSLRQRLDIQYETVIGSTNPGAFEPKKVWVDWKRNVACSVFVRRGQEHFMQSNDGQGGQRFSKDQWQFTVRYNSVIGIDPTMRIKHGGMYFDIRHIRPDDQTRREMMIECEVQDAVIGAAPLVPSVLDFIREGVVGTPYQGFAISAEGGVAPYTFAEESAGLPPGLVLDINSGAISGTPTTAGVWPVDIQVMDVSGAVAPISFEITINE